MPSSGVGDEEGGEEGGAILPALPLSTGGCSWSSFFFLFSVVGGAVTRLVRAWARVLFGEDEGGIGDDPACCSDIFLTGGMPGGAATEVRRGERDR